MPENDVRHEVRALHVRGPFKGASGYDHHVRELVRELHHQGVAVELVDVPEWGPVKLPASQRDPWYETLTRPTGARVAVQFCMPHQLILHDDLMDVNYTMFEADRVHPYWVAQNRKCALLVVPTESSRRAWLASGMPDEQIRVCPLGINPVLFGEATDPLPLRLASGAPVAQYRTRFLNVSEASPRKNLPGLVAAWLRTTSRDDDAVLILKVSGLDTGSGGVVSEQVSQLEAKLGKRREQAAPIHVVREVFSDAELPRLYAAATHYLSMSHGEGWDQTMVEAAATGLRLIAPNHSAYTSYLDPSVARLIASREVPAAWPGGGVTAALFENANWWEPDEGEAARYVREAIDGRDAGLGSARERILQDLTWEHATRRLISILGEAEEASRRRARWRLPRWSKTR